VNLCFAHFTHTHTCHTHTPTPPHTPHTPPHTQMEWDAHPLAPAFWDYNLLMYHTYMSTILFYNYVPSCPMQVPRTCPPPPFSHSSPIYDGPFITLVDPSSNYRSCRLIPNLVDRDRTSMRWGWASFPYGAYGLLARRQAKQLSWWRRITLRTRGLPEFAGGQNRVWTVPVQATDKVSSSLKL